MMKIDLNGQIELLDDDEKCFQDGISGGSKITFQGSDLKLNAAVEGELERTDDRNQQTQNTVEHWDRFLNVRSIRVLLVENDDSTRHVVSALLRNCNYEVIDASNGRQAWKILEDLTNHIDIVLTEIVLPLLSGIALLRKITSHKSRKNIPVIMMSSHDSMSLVFNCLSKGAVSFLVKPIRKNELKNFWQHVWRRCHSSSRSGSESGTHTKKSVKSKSSEKADNSGSDDGGNNVINGLNVGDGSDDGNGTQSSRTKQTVEVVEVDSSLSMSRNEHVADCADSTCAQVISPTSENSGHGGVHVVLAREAHGQSQPDTVAKGKDLEKLTPKNVESKSKNPMTIPAGSKPKSLTELDCSMSIKQVDKGQLNLTGEISAPLVDGKESGSAREVSIILDINNYATDESKEANFELSIKRLRGVQERGGSVQDDRCVVPRYEQSAFSRYNASSNIFKALDGTTRCNSLNGNTMEAAKHRSVSDAQIHSTEHLVYQSSNEASNNIDMGSTTNKSHACPSTVNNNKSQTTSKVKSLHSSAIRPMKNNIRYTQPQISYNEVSLKKLAEDARQCGSTNVMSGPIDCNLQNYSLNRSGSGSNHGSSTAVNGVGTYMKSDYGQARKSPNGNDSGSGSGAGGDENRLTLREAAVLKFRQKRKDRTFKKKVRYQTRKKLAEQRPRVRGQFVKQTGMDSSNRRKDE